MQRWIGISITVVCLAGLALISLPVPNKSIVYQSMDPAWSLKIIQPEYMRSGENATLTVEVTPPDTQGTSLDTGAVGMRLDFPGLFQGANQATQMVNLGESVSFPWILGPARAGKYEGRVWIYNGLQKTLLNVQSVQIDVRGPDAVILYVLRIVLLAAALGSLYLVFLRRTPRVI